MPYLKFRYHLTDDVADGHVRSYLTSFSEHLVIQHEADEKVARTHWHALLWTTDTVQTTRGRLKSTLTFLNKSSYSLGLVKPGQEARYVQYMCHMAGLDDPVNVVARQSLRWSSEELQELNAKFWEEHKAHATPPEAHPVDQRPKFCVQLLEFCNAQDVDTSSPADVIKAAVRLTRVQNRPIQAHYIDACVNFVLAHDKDGAKLLEQRLLRPWNYA